MVKLNNDVTVFFAIFIGVILAVVLLSAASDSIFSSTTSLNVTNNTVTAPSTNNSVAVTGRDLTSQTYDIWNLSNGTEGFPFLVDTDGNVTLQEEIINGAKTVTLLVNQNGSAYSQLPLNITYNFNPDGFVSGTGGTILALVVLFGALAVLIFVVVKVTREGSMKNFMEGFGKK